MSKKSTSAVLARLKILTQTDTDTNLSSALGISPQTLSSWKTRESTPYAICVEMAESTNVSLDWILLGEGCGPDEIARAKGSISVTDTASDADVLTAFRELSPEDQRIVRSFIQEKLRLHDLEKKLADLTSVLADINKPA
ncbi:helix-turn-helix domain containing protein [Pseudomonas viridiflava]|uniref:helix-turn-helix domain-containing protein n=1 Tax=Pseudomonas viridiflava TaxID=33069 RepID=UPI001F612479|nr:helix-turn-helix domain-containing protein [Pseudomonas viridiflava]MCI3908830.1 helix-turn-helix domain containing protein [Pseudomonas viridiflava]